MPPTVAQPRIDAFDVARGLAVLFMILIHVLRHWGETATWTSPLGLVLSFAGGPLAAPVFMTLMGASLAFSSRRSVLGLVRRGAWLLAAAYVFNVARGALPLTLAHEAGLLTPDDVRPYTPWSLLTMVDILQLAGASLILLALLRAVVRPGIVWLVLAVAVVLVAPLLREVRTGEPALDAVLAVLWATGSNVFYPVFPWLVFPLLGAVIGEQLRATAEPSRLMRRLAVLGLALCGAGLGLLLAESPVLDAVTYWRLPPFLVPGILGVVLVWLALCHAAARMAAGTGALAVVAGWSRRVTGMYVIHWLVVAWGIGFVGHLALGLLEVVVAMIAVVVLTDLLSRVKRATPAPATGPVPLPA